MLKSCDSEWNSSLKMLIVCIDYDFKKLVCLCFFFSRRTAHRSNNMRSSAKNATIMNFLKRTSRSDHCCVSWELLFPLVLFKEIDMTSLAFLFTRTYFTSRYATTRYLWWIHKFKIYLIQKINLTSQLVQSELLYMLWIQLKKKNVHK